MLGGGRKSSVKLTKNQPFSLVSIFFCFLLLSRTFGRHYSRHRTSHHYLHHNQTLQQPYVVVAPPLPLSLFSAKIFFPLRHRDSNSSSDHPFQRLPPLPAVVEAATLSSSAPTASDRSTDRDSSSTCNSSNVATACTTSSSSVRPLSRQVTFLFLFLPLFFITTVHCVNSRREL